MTGSSDGASTPPRSYTRENYFPSSCDYVRKELSPVAQVLEAALGPIVAIAVVLLILLAAVWKGPGGALAGVYTFAVRPLAWALIIFGGIAMIGDAAQR